MGLASFTRPIMRPHNSKGTSMNTAYKILAGVCALYTLTGIVLAGRAEYKLHKITAAKKASKN
nr:MAG TPA: hypothetical protein [Caudoviricetes sp.]